MTAAASLSFAQKSLFGDITENVKATGFHFDLGYSGTGLRGKMLNGFHMNTSIVLNQHYTTGFYVESYTTNSIVYPSLKAAVNPKFSFSTFNWHHEVVFLPKHVVNFSTALNIGLAEARYKDFHL